MKICKLPVLFLILFIWACKPDTYMPGDFASVKKIDAHFHIYTGKNSIIQQARKDNFSLICINTYSEDCGRVMQTQSWLDSLKKSCPDDLNYTSTFCLDGWDEPGWTEKTLNWIDSCIGKGAVAVKVWKNIGMEFRDKDGKLVMIDNPRFDPVFQYLAKVGIPVAGHLGEPKNCWLPLEKMTTKNDSNYFAKNPQYHMFLHPEMPSYEEQMAARDRMLAKNPDLIFIGCHLASLEWSVDELARFLDLFPHAAVDLSARMGQIFFQTRDDRGKVRRFFMQYRDRILYGTDIIDGGSNNPESFQKRVHDTWVRDWEFLTTDNEMTSPLIRGTFRGLKLPREVVIQIFYQNAVNWYNLGED